MNTIKRYWRIIFPIFFIVLSWYFSDKIGEVSDRQSSVLADYFGISNALMRKIAHVVLFGAIGYSISSFVKGLNTLTYPTSATFSYCLVAIAIYAAIDEVHQLTVQGRNGSIGDIFLDVLAGLGGIFLYILIFCIVRGIIRRHSNYA